MSTTNTTFDLLRGFDAYTGLSNLRDDIDDSSSVAAYVNDRVRTYKTLPVADMVSRLALVSARQEINVSTTDFKTNKMGFYLGGMLGLRAVELGADLELVETLQQQVAAGSVAPPKDNQELFERQATSLDAAVAAGRPILAAIDLPLNRWAETVMRSDEANQQFINGMSAMVVVGAQAANIRAERYISETIDAYEAQW